MSMPPFTLHPRLTADTHVMGDLPLCRVLLMNDKRFPWLILVPRRTNLHELTDLVEEDRPLLFDEITKVSAVLRKICAPDRINVAAIGNIVNQLHVHVVARMASDAAWPGTVWGHAGAKPYDQAALLHWHNELLPFLAAVH
jgi:diadenosine tetraphosphate (Ap4A) HIT family hydrolase